MITLKDLHSGHRLSPPPRPHLPSSAAGVRWAGSRPASGRVRTDEWSSSVEGCGTCLVNSFYEKIYFWDFGRDVFCLCHTENQEISHDARGSATARRGLMLEDLASPLTLFNFG